MDLKEQVKTAVIKASTTFREDQVKAYQKALEAESNPQASWVLELLVENSEIANKNCVPLCDDTGIPHVLVEMGNEAVLPADFIKDIREGIKTGLKELPGRPMAVKGNDVERIEQSKGLYDDPGMVLSPSFIFDELDPIYNQEIIRVHVLMLGGGPEIRASTHRVFHRRDHQNILDEITEWMKVELPRLGCTPAIPAVGIGRTHLEASSLMLKAMAYGNLDLQSNLEKSITQTINSLGIGALNMGGAVSALGSFVKIGPQRASGVRILCMRPCCCVEPRVSSFDYCR
ncbi:MAG TPA: fumarate hydratase [Methanobacterium sp.]|nr:fumarate hydratase [Methanobacterium sp.]